MSELIEVKEDTNVEIGIKCDLVASKTARLDELLMGIIYSRNPEGLVIDMKDVEMVDSTGISLLLAIFNYLGDRNCTFRLINLSRDITDLFVRMRLDIHFDIHNND